MRREDSKRHIQFSSLIAAIDVNLQVINMISMHHKTMFVLLTNIG